MPAPSWLPPMIAVNPWTSETFDALYRIFESDFKRTQPMYEARPVWFFPETENGRERLFWHLTHREDRDTGERLPDPRRCERLPWIRKVIDNAHESEVLDWDYQEGDGTTKTYLWLKDHDFLVLMKRYDNGSRRLFTSFYVDYAHTRRTLEKKYSRRL